MKKDKKKQHKPELYNRRCCYNCKHHLAFESGPKGDTIVCPFMAKKEYKTASGTSYIGVDYTKRIPASHVPCDLWRIDTNIPAGFSWPFLQRQDATQLSLSLSI